MFILNQIIGIGGFSIADNLRLIIIVAIFIGIIAVLLYLKSAKNGRKAKGKYTQAVNSHNSSSEEERHSTDAEDDFLSIEEEIKAKNGGFFEDTIEPEVETEEVPVVNLDKTVADIEDMEGRLLHQR